MSNNTYNNVNGGIKIAIGGSNANAFITAINSANIYGVSANVTSGNINIIYNVPGPIKIVETDIINTPLANAGIRTGEYGSGANSFVITGTNANATFNSNSYFGIGINWNSILNSVSQSNRRFIKEIWVAQQERQKIGTPSYRPLNVFINSVSPQPGHPWEL